MGLQGIKNIATLDIINVLREVLRENLDDVKDVSKEQLSRGETPSGGKLPTYKSKRYVAKKPNPKTAPGGRMNLRLTGDFYKGITPKIAKTAITWPQSQQERKYPFLVKYSDDGRLLTWNERSIQGAKKSFLLKELVRKLKMRLN